jgi:hypothetical protein
VARLKRENNLRGCIADTLSSLDGASPVADGTFDLALDNLVSESFDSESLWTLFGACFK